MKRTKLYLILALIYILLVVLMIKYFSEFYKTIFLYALIIFLIKDLVVDLILKKQVWLKKIEHLPFSIIVFFLWMSGYVSHLIGFLAFVSLILNFWLNQKK